MNFDGLTEDQSEAAGRVLDFVASRREREFTLRGYAGTGKTFLAGRLIRSFLGQGKSVVLAAPTNKAAKVLQSMAGGVVGACTVHQFLGLSPVIDEDTGEEVFKESGRRPAIDTKPDVLLVDECPMVSKDLYEKVLSLTSKKTKILWVGDPAQLPPIGEIDSLTFGVENGFELTNVVRYDNEIGELADAIRNDLHNPKVRDFVEAPGRIGVMGKVDWMKAVIQEFKSSEYSDSADYVRAVAWRNSTVDWGNSRVHREVYGDKAPEYVPGQRVIAKSPIFQDGSLIAGTSEEFVIRSARLARDGVHNVWEMVLSFLGGGSIDAVALAASSRVDFNERLGKALARARETKGHYWRVYYEMKKRYADVGPCYFSTVHKAQGSTFQKCYVAVPDILLIRAAYERNRMLYTAATRPSQYLGLAQ